MPPTGWSGRIVPRSGFLPALPDPAGKGCRLQDPHRHLRLVEVATATPRLVVLVDVEMAHFILLGLARRVRAQRRAAEQGHFDVLREAMKAGAPAAPTPGTPAGLVLRVGVTSSVKLIVCCKRWPRSIAAPSAAQASSP
mgnify:CR=1 FL=1